MICLNSAGSPARLRSLIEKCYRVHFADINDQVKCTLIKCILEAAYLVKNAMAQLTTGM